MTMIHRQVRYVYCEQNDNECLKSWIKWHGHVYRKMSSLHRADCQPASRRAEQLTRMSDVSVFHTSKPGRYSPNHGIRLAKDRVSPSVRPASAWFRNERRATTGPRALAQCPPP